MRCVRHTHRRRQEQFQRNPDSYNGAVRENYAWSQDYTDLELKVPVPKHVVKGKQPPTQNRFSSAVTSLPPHILFNHVKLYLKQACPVQESGWGPGKPLEYCYLPPVSDECSSFCSTEDRSRTGAPEPSRLHVGVRQGVMGLVAAAALSARSSLSPFPTPSQEISPGLSDP
ncbi:hypothetical protein J1605_013397 [Eschrichtius robustus]|uniref:Uncharacterized protein n=1 Tax=Eschrichtius robustus TaxID=9764 RepID=A0AB34GJ28_ESCRO|nr:hypothetical protein J1605_013397 [Eschrichtius robustus]